MVNRQKRYYKTIQYNTCFLSCLSVIGSAYRIRIIDLQPSFASDSMFDTLLVRYETKLTNGNGNGNGLFLHKTKIIKNSLKLLIQDVLCGSFKYLISQSCDRICKEGVRGSNPLSSTKNDYPAAVSTRIF